MEHRWGDGPPAGGDAIDQLVYLSNVIGADPRLVQPGGGNTSVKLGTTLAVKGSGTDLRTIGRAGFTHLSLPALEELRARDQMTDAEMMQFMAGCMVQRDQPVPSVETPLHALLAHRVIVHTHDVATMSLTNVPDATAERLVSELFEGTVVYVPYVHPGFPLARQVRELANGIEGDALGLALAHHGLVVWAEDAAECYRRLAALVTKIDEYVVTSRRGRRVLGDVRLPDEDRATRRARAAVVLPALRGALAGREPVILHFDDAPEVLDRLAAARFRELTQRGMATPEHILRAGRLPIWLDVDETVPSDRVVAAVRTQVAERREEYLGYHRRHATSDETPLDDWVKVVLVPGLGMITAFRDKKGAETANLCYRAVMEAIENAESLAEFRFLPEAEIFEFEHWPLERRKVAEAGDRERAARLLPRAVAVVIGGASGIGQAAAHRFAEEGAHVVVADLDGAAAASTAAALADRHPRRVIGLPVDVRDEQSIATLVRETVLAFGGVDALFYAAGVAPRFAPITDLTRDDFQQQFDVHVTGAVLAIGAAARVMQHQGRGGAIVASVSKAALAPGKEAGAYGASKAALLQALRVAAVELGKDGIRVNAINADQVETPLFKRFVEERARAKGITVEEQLAAYQSRNALGASLIPAEAVADLAVLLASDRFRYTTGDILTVDGGLPDAFPR